MLLCALRAQCLQDMVISVKETTGEPIFHLHRKDLSCSVFSVFHPDAQDLYNTCSDLKKVAWTLFDPNFHLHANVCCSILADMHTLTNNGCSG